MGVLLIEVAEEMIEALVVGLPGRARPSQAPFADDGRAVTLFLQHAADRSGARRQRELAEFLGPAADGVVAAHRARRRALALHKGRPGRRADRTPGVMLRKPHAVFGQRIEVRRADFRLTVNADFVVSEVIREYVDDIRLVPVFGILQRVFRGRPGDRDNDSGGNAENEPTSHECLKARYSVVRRCATHRA